jgi:hypothetical protein
MNQEGQTTTCVRCSEATGFAVHGVCFKCIERLIYAESKGRYVFAVVCGNYEPAEIDSLWDTSVLAQERAEKMGGMWTAKCYYMFISAEEFEQRAG